ncbi:MAG: sugar transferase [Celeribacter sp.]|jgi:lipopolysaccharide/colanic/teichoic acid biosynthesis glycosyltransferase
MFDYGNVGASSYPDVNWDDASLQESRALYFRFKRVLDILCALVFLPLMISIGAALLVLNLFFNRGPLLYVQKRMGRNCRAFPAIKFRTMRTATQIVRGADDPLEVHRITRLGWLLRKTRLDELPQILNVLRGDMSMIGPRPDYFHHARRYARVIPGYRARHVVRPGISGLAQVDLGYAAGIDATAAKVAADLHYIQHAGYRLDTLIFWRTLVTVVTGRGA